MFSVHNSTVEENSNENLKQICQIFITKLHGSSFALLRRFQRSFKAYQSFSVAFRMIAKEFPMDSEEIKGTLGEFQGIFRWVSGSFKALRSLRQYRGYIP